MLLFQPQFNKGAASKKSKTAMGYNIHMCIPGCMSTYTGPYRLASFVPVFSTCSQTKNKTSFMDVSLFIFGRSPRYIVTKQ